MQRNDPPLVTAAILLAALAGFVDALVFTSLGGFFASSMSGNATRLGVGLGTGATGHAMVAGALLLSFVSGVILATVLARAMPGRDRAATMAAVAALLVAGAVAMRLAPGTLAVLLLAIAMGAAHVPARHAAEALGGTEPTGALVRMGERLAGALMGDADRLGWFTHFLLWAAFAAGAVLGAGSWLRLGPGACWVAACIAGVIALWSLAVPRAMLRT